MNDLIKDLLVATYGVVLAELIPFLVDRHRKRTPKQQPKHFKRS